MNFAMGGQFFQNGCIVELTFCIFGRTSRKRRKIEPKLGKLPVTLGNVLNYIQFVTSHSSARIEADLAIYKG